MSLFTGASRVVTDYRAAQNRLYLAENDGNDRDRDMARRALADNGIGEDGYPTDYTGPRTTNP